MKIKRIPLDEEIMKRADSMHASHSTAFKEDPFFGFEFDAEEVEILHVSCIYKLSRSREVQLPFQFRYADDGRSVWIGGSSEAVMRGILYSQMEAIEFIFVVAE